VSFARLLSHVHTAEGRERMRRCFGLDVHREFAQVAIWEEGRVRHVGQIETTPEALRLFADSLAPSDQVAIEATCNTHAIAKLLEPRVGRVVVSNPQKTRRSPRPRSRPTRSTPRCSPSYWPRITCRRCGCPTRRRMRSAAR